MTTPRFTLHHAPRSRSFRALWMLEESGLGFEVAVHDLSAATHKAAEYLAVNPDGKVPALVDRGPDGAWSAPVVVTESAAICAYVADLAPEVGLAPPLGDRDRGPYLTWLLYAAAAIEPSFADSVFPRAAEVAKSTLGWPPFAEAMGRAGQALEAGPWLLGARFTAADVMLGALVHWFAGWKKLPDIPVFHRYLADLRARPAMQRAIVRDQALIAARTGG